MGVSRCGGRSVSKIISVFSGNRARSARPDRVPITALFRLQEAVNATRLVAPMSCKNPRRFMDELPIPARFLDIRLSWTFATAVQVRFQSRDGAKSSQLNQRRHFGGVWRKRCL